MAVQPYNYAQAASPTPLPPTRSDEQSIDVSRSASYGLCKGTDTRTWDKCIGTKQLGDIGEYSGEFMKGRPEGSGRFNGRDGSLYQGEFRNGAPAGKGRFTSPTGSVYLGSFDNGVANGEGRETSSDGSIYTGTYVNGLREGQGRLDYKDGRHVTGEFKADHIDGYGTYSFPNGDEYTGVIAQDKLTDRGIYRFANGDRYVGDYEDFKPSGPGVYTFVSGMKWIGEFRNGVPAGKGSLYDSGGELILESEFKGFESLADAKAAYDKKKSSAETISAPSSASAPSAPSASAGIDASTPLSDSEAATHTIFKDDGSGRDKTHAGPTQDMAALADKAGIKSEYPPLKCHRAGDVLILFISCDVMVPQAIVDEIRFADSACLSGTDYLSVYDRARAAPWSDMFNQARAYFYFRPFDYRGPHRYREKIYFLVSGCRTASDFIVTVNQQDWVWPLASDTPKRIR